MEEAFEAERTAARIEILGRDGWDGMYEVMEIFASVRGMWWDFRVLFIVFILFLLRGLRVQGDRGHNAVCTGDEDVVVL